MVDTSQSCPTNVSSKVELELHSARFREMVLSGDGALAAKVVADSHSVVDLHGAGCWDCRCVVVVAEVEGSPY